MEDAYLYGPERPEENHDYTKFTTPLYLRGYSRKILLDLLRVARMYNGRLARIFRPGQGERCPDCVNTMTGERLLTNCKRCHGTGLLGSWDRVGEFWTYVDFGPKYKVATDLGNVENPGGVKEQIIVLGAPLLKDQYLLAFVETREVYKIYDVEPHIIALRGEVIAQMTSASRITPGGEEYAVITW